jgi:hypothetical protein
VGLQGAVVEHHILDSLLEVVPNLDSLLEGVLNQGNLLEVVLNLGSLLEGVPNLDSPLPDGELNLDIPLEVVPTPDNPQLDVVEQSLDNLLPELGNHFQDSLTFCCVSLSVVGL